MKPLDPSIKVQWSAQALEKIKHPSPTKKELDKKNQDASAEKVDFKSVFDRNWKTQGGSTVHPMKETEGAKAVQHVQKTPGEKLSEGIQSEFQGEFQAQGLKVNFSSQAQALNKENQGEVARTQEREQETQIRREPNRARKQYETIQNTSDGSLKKPSWPPFDIKIE